MDNEMSSEKMELLKFLYDHRIGEVNFLRERQDKIFAWSSNIFMALIGALLIIEPSKAPVWAFTLQSKLVASLAVSILMFFSIRWQQRTHSWQSESGQVIQKMEQLLHCYDKGYFDHKKDLALFPMRWNNPEIEKPPSFMKTIFSANYISATVILGILAVVMIWVRS